MCLFRCLFARWNVHQELTDMVTAGKSTDFMVLDANLLENTNNTRRISDVYLRGKKVDRAAMRGGFAANWR